ncbi:MAG: ribosome small subunit-dependent GTPase A, partial [Acutalibacteraceae bacterium]
MEGRILCSNGGFYYVEVAIGDAREVLECRARGLFRKQKLTPLVGDIAVVEPTVELGKGFVVEIRPRRNQLIRPPVANVDQLLLVIAVADPAPVPLVIDQMIAIAEKNGIEPIVVVNKSDLGDTGRWEAIYKAAGLRVEALSALDVQGVQPLRALLSGRISAFTGNSGVGKSSLLNALYPDLELATGEISRKLGRGRHTTRTVTL